MRNQETRQPKIKSPRTGGACATRVTCELRACTLDLRTAPKTFLAKKSANSAPFKRGETKVQIFGKEKCKTLRQY